MEDDMEENSEFSSTVELQLESRSGQLGKLPKEFSDRASAVLREMAGGKWGVKGIITHIEHGKYDGKPATLIAFRTNFRFDPGSRFTKAEVRISFNSHEAGTDSANGLNIPVVKNFSPVLVQGRGIEAEITKERSATVDVSLAPAIASIAGVGVSGSYGRADKYSKVYQMRITAIPWCDKTEVENSVIWKIAENGKQAEGIPNELNTAIVIQHDGGIFQAVIEIKAWTGLGTKLFGWPWPKPHPLIIRPLTSLGPKLGLNSFDELVDEQWGKLAPFYGIADVSSLEESEASIANVGFVVL
jgi:hypothetical protein